MVRPDFLVREVPRFGRPLFRLGLSGSFGLDEAGCREALERMQYVFWTPRMKKLTPALRDALARDRDRFVVATGPLLGFFPGSLRKAVERARRPVVVSYTATSWRKLLAAPKGWTGRVPGAGDCYRFCLSSPHVDVALTGPRTIVQLRENLAALERGPLSAEEDTWMRAVGRAVHG